MFKNLPRRLGYFEIDFKADFSEVEEVFSRLRIVPLEVRHLFDVGRSRFEAYSPFFEEVAEGYRSPQYGIIVTKDDDGEIEDISVEKISPPGSAYGRA